MIVEGKAYVRILKNKRGCHEKYAVEVDGKIVDSWNIADYDRCPDARDHAMEEARRLNNIRGREIGEAGGFEKWCELKGYN